VRAWQHCPLIKTTTTEIKTKITALTIQIAGVAAAESGHKRRFLAARKKPKSAMKMLADTEREEALNLVSFPQGFCRYANANP